MIKAFDLIEVCTDQYLMASILTNIHMEVKEVDRINGTVTISNDFWMVMLANGRIISQTGYLTDMQRKQCLKRYYAIFPKKK